MSLSKDRLDGLYRGCAYCENNISEAECSCPSFDEIRFLVETIRKLQKDQDEIIASEEAILDKAGHLSFTAWLSEYKYLQEQLAEQSKKSIIDEN